MLGARQYSGSDNASRFTFVPLRSRAALAFVYIFDTYQLGIGKLTEVKVFSETRQVLPRLTLWKRSQLV
jgi:hypothetical protein